MDPENLRYTKEHEWVRVEGDTGPIGITFPAQKELGDIVSVAGNPEVQIGETLTYLANPEALPLINIEEPTLKMTFSINNSPLAGREGKFVTSRQLKDRLWREVKSNVSLRVEEGDSAFIDDHELPDGNYYMMRNGGGTIQNQAHHAVADGSDLTTFLDTFRNTTPTDQWWRERRSLEEELQAALREGGVEAGEDELRVHAAAEHVGRDDVGAGRGVAEAEGAGVAHERDVDAQHRGRREVSARQSKQIEGQLSGRGGGGILDAPTDDGRAGGVMIDDERALRIEVLQERLHAVGLAGIENEVEIRLAERLDRLVAG